MKAHHSSATTAAARGKIFCSGSGWAYFEGLFALAFLLFLWIFGFAFWTELSSLLPFYRHLAFIENFMTEIGIVISLSLAARVWHKVREERSFGSIHLQMDPFPAGPGGDVGGVIFLPMELPEGRYLSLTLKCSQYKLVKSRKKSRLRETILWQATGRPQTLSSGLGTRLAFRFSPAADLPPSQNEPREKVLWSLTLRTLFKGRVFLRYFDLPLGRNPRHSSFELQQHPPTNNNSLEVGLPPEYVRQRRKAGQHIFYFPDFINYFGHLLASLFGLLITALCGLAVWHSASADLMDGLMTFFATGPFIVLGLALLSMSVLIPMSYKLIVTPLGLEWQRFWFTLPLKGWVLSRAEIQNLTHSAHAQEDSEQNLRQDGYYHLVVHTTDGRQLSCSGEVPGLDVVELLEKKVKERLHWEEAEKLDLSRIV